MQSAYRKFHSTETALLRVHNDISVSLDKGHVTALTLLDLSAAFDTIDHNTLTSRLAEWYGVSGMALAWFKSYLCGRHQKIKIEKYFSDSSLLEHGVPQCTWSSAFQFVHRSSKHHYFKLWIESSLIRR